MKYIPALCVFLVVVIGLGLYAWLVLDLWRECRMDHSFFYCAKVLG